MRHVRSGEPRRRLARVALLVALLLATSMSGCISLDFFLPRKYTPEEVPEGSGLVRLWIAVQPGALGSEFVQYNVTFGPSGHIQDVFGQKVAPMNSTNPTVDLVHLERARQAVPIAGLIVRPGTYHGYTFNVTHATLTYTEVVGNDGGEEVVKYHEKDIDENRRRASIGIQHDVFADSITDLFIEIDMRKSLTEDDGAFLHATVLVGTSVYVNGHKAVEERNLQHASKRAQGKDFTPYGGRFADAGQGPSPTARYEVYDEVRGGKVFDSLKTNRHYTKLVGLGQDLRFSSRSYSNVFEQGEQGRMSQLLWNFADGTTAAGGTARHNWTSGGIYDVSLTVRDEYDLVGRTHGTFIVPYRAEEAVLIQQDARADRILLGSAMVPTAPDLYSASEQLAFPQDLENGDLRLGGYRTTVRFQDPSGGLAGAGTLMKAHVESGHLKTTVEGTSPLVVESAGLAVWWPLGTPWVAPTIDVDLELLTGAYVSYEVTVEALYYQNMTRGLDGHGAHRHGTWPFGPDIRTTSWNGTAAPPQEEEA